jgi:cellulose synthase/poly-beta-1,6-N-acetylglucosamine synthase-like glycosyltransferase
MTGALEVVLDVAAVGLTVPLLVASSWLLVLTLLSWRPKPLPLASAPSLRFDLIVPAHDEASGIATTVKSLLALDYPVDLRRVVVIADNCTDDTAARAREAGALVLERHDLTLRGKGYALKEAFARSLDAPFTAGAVVVIDADTVVSPNLLRAFEARLSRGAQAAQADYRVRNPEASWRTRLMTIALAAFHQVRSLGRARLGVSSGLRGNGMCLRTSLLRAVPYDAFSLVEDLEYGLRLGEARICVEYAPEALVFGEMVSEAAGSRSQRLRWEQGRALLRRSHGFSLLCRGLAQRSLLLLDLALDVLIPPLAQLLVAEVGALLAFALLWAVLGVGGAAALACAFALGCLGVYVLGGWWHSATGARGLLDLAFAPVYVVWKLALPRRAAAAKGPEWIRTSREERTDR